MIKAQRRNFKKNRIMVCFSLLLTVILSMSAPFSITSKASAVGLPLTVNVDSYLAAFYSMLLGHGILPDSLSDPFASTKVDYDAVADVFKFYDELNSYKEGLGDEVESAVLAGTLDGRLLLSEEGQKDLVEYLQLTGQIPLVSYGKTVPLNAACYDTQIIVKYHTQNNPQILTTTTTISSTSDYFIGYRYTSDSNWDHLIFICNLGGTYPQYIVQAGSSNWNCVHQEGINTYFTTSSGESFLFKAHEVKISNAYNGIPGFYIIDNITITGVSYNAVLYDVNLADLMYNMVHSGVASFDDTITGSSVIGTQEVVNPASSVTEEGEIEGGYSGVVIPYDTLTQLINAVKSGVLTIKDAIRSVGLNLVESDATADEKQQSINTIVEVVPSTSITLDNVDSQSIAESSEKVGTLAHIEHAIANAIAQATGQALPYPDEDPDYVPPGDPHIENWEFPSLDPNDPDPGGSEQESHEDRNRAADVAGGISVVAGLASNIFDSASGFNLVTTVGYSFVIFSAILGASHFFGALGGRHDDVKSHPLDWNRSERWNSKQTDFKSDW